MSMRSLLMPILDNERVTAGLDDAEARLLIEWLVERTEALHAKIPNEASVRTEVQRLCRRARGIARFVSLWCHDRLPGPALQLAATERFTWPLPTEEMDPCDLLGDILAWEDTSEPEA